MFFHEVLEGKPDPIFGLMEAFLADSRPQKVNLMVGVYHDEELRKNLLPSVKRAKEEIFEFDQKGDYLPITGLADFCEEVGRLLFGERVWRENHGRIFSAHTVGGTGALRVAGEFLVQEVSREIFISHPTWPNHRSVFERAGCKVEEYPYYSKEMCGFDCQAMCRVLETMPEKAAVLLHAACHNPTGCDPSREEWREISKIMKRKRLLPVFDFAYHGLGGGIERDREALLTFLEEGHEMLICYSCSKNFSLYCQRVGALFIVDENAAVKLRVGSQVKRIIRALYSNPPMHGALIVAHLLKKEALKKAWLKDLEEMRTRLSKTRKKLIDALPPHFAYLEKHKGMFSFIDLDKHQVQQMINDYAIYLTDNGRINVAGLTQKNLDYVTKSLLHVCAQ